MNEFKTRGDKVSDSNKDRREMTELQNEMAENIVKAQKIVLEHLEDVIKEGDSATVAAMAEILKF